jgi:hypothetical protein
VLILGDLQARLLILLDLKSFIISDLIKNDEFAEVLILEGLGGAVGRDGWNRAGEAGRAECSRSGGLPRGRADRRWCSECTPHRSTDGYSMSIYIYGLAFECLWIFFRMRVFGCDAWNRCLAAARFCIVREGRGCGTVKRRDKTNQLI